ncbi:Dead deah box RNA helicase, partial [Globisporangium splendens]
MMLQPSEPQLDYADSSENSHDEGYFTPAQGPSLSYERKIRLHKYAENRARSCLGLLSDSSNVLWKLHDTKYDVELFKPSTDWSEFVSGKAIVENANVSFLHVLKVLYDLKTSEKFKLFLRKVLGDMFLDADVLEDLNGTGVYPNANPPKDPREVYKQASIKWWAIKSGSLASKSTDFYVLEYIGIETQAGEIVSCYLFQESLAEVGGMPHIQGNYLERSQFDALICKFERRGDADDGVRIKIAFQRPPPMVTLFRSNPAIEMVLQFAKGIRDLLENPSEPQEISVVKTSAWVKDKYTNEHFYALRADLQFCESHFVYFVTIRVPSISFTHNESGKQVLSRHQPSIRVCTKCVVSNHRSKSGRDLNNQEDLTEWMRSNSQGQLAEHPFHQRMLSPSHSQDLSGALDDGDRERGQRNQLEGQLSRKYRRLSIEDDEEEKEDGDGQRRGTQKESMPGYNNNQEEERLSELRRMGKRPSDSKRNNNVPARHSNQETRKSNPTVRTRRSQSQSDVSNARGGSTAVTRTSGGSNRNIANEQQRYPNGQRDSARLPSGRDYVVGSLSSNDGLLYSFDTRPSATEQLVVPNSSYVHAASAWATNKTEVLAMTGAFQELLTKLGGDVHFVVVGFSTGFDADVIVDLLRQLAPGVPYIGGTIARGMCDENAWVSVNRHNDEGLITLWGVNDPHGIYSVVHAKYSQSDAREKAFAAAKTAYARVSADIDPGEKPAFISVYACPLFVEHAIEGIREAIHCPIIGGCSSDAAKHRDGESSVSWIQISSSSSSDYTKSVRDGRGDWTEMGVAFALCFPSVETYVSWFSGYSPVGTNSEYCMGTVTKASNKTIYEIDSKPAAEVYQEWLDVVSDKTQSDLSSIGFPRLGNLHPLGTTIDFVTNQMETERPHEVTSTSSLCSMQSSDWSKLINMTAVITGINEDGSLSTTSSIASGTNVVLMETSAQSLKTAINKMGTQAVESNKFYIHETIGCLMFLSAGVQALLGHKSMAEMVGAYKDWSGGASLMGMTTFGEIGHLPNSSDFPHYDSLMFGAIIFSKRKRKEYLY